MPNRRGGRTNHPGTRARHRRRKKNGGTTAVRAAPIRYPQAQQKRARIARQVQQGKRPLLWGAAGLAGLGALEAILMGRWFTGITLLSGAAALGITHVAWQAHKRRQASKPQRQAAAQQRRQAKPLTKRQAEEAQIQKLHEGSTRLTVKERAFKEGWRRRAERVWFGRDEADRRATQRKAALRWPKRSTKPQAAPKLAEPVRVGLDPWPQQNGNGQEPTTHQEWQARHGNGHRCDCRECRGKRRADAKAKAEALQ